MISQTVEYSLRAIVTLADRHDNAMTVRQIAAITKVPGPYLSKLMQRLVRAGLVRSQRGLGGGFSLERQPSEVTMWDIVEAVDPLKRIESCPLGIERHTELCSLHRRIDQAISGVEQAFRATTLAEMVSETGPLSPLCSQSDDVVALSTPTESDPIR